MAAGACSIVCMRMATTRAVIASIAPREDSPGRVRFPLTELQALSPWAGERVWHEERAGDDWLWIWGQDIAGPGVKSAAGGTMEGTTNVVGGLWNQNPPHGTWKLVSGRMYKISANQEGRIVPFETTPRFTGRSN